MNDRQQGSRQKSVDALALRKRAEEQTQGMEPISLSARTPEEIQQVFHELRVHQIELEMQNEELRSAQARIEAGLTRYFDLYDLAPVGYCTLSEKGLILEANLTAATLLGVTRSALVMQPISSFICREDQDIYYLQRKQLFETGVPQKCDLRLVKADSGLIWANLTGTVAEADDGAPLCRMVLSDITERKRAEADQEKLQAQLAQAQKMESVGRLAGGVAHDFNNMLMVILGYTEMALEQVAWDEPLHGSLKAIKDAAKRSADLTHQLLTYARKEIVAPKVVDLNESIENTLKLLRRFIGEDIDLAWQPGKSVWPIKMDTAQIEKILTNLVVNARDAIVGVGKLTIETDKTTFDEEYCRRNVGFVPGDYVLLSVSDNGCGMDAQTRAQIFEPFFTTKEMGKGTGLGLATVYGVVKQNNGFVNVYSEPGQGTTFRIYLPRHVLKTEIETEENQLLAAAQGSETVLLVEDEVAILAMTKMMLQRMGYTVLTADTPGKAIHLAQEHPGRIDLLMTDVIMPEMNGRDLARHLLSIHPHIHQLFMSGYTTDVITHHGMLDEEVHFIQKPFTLKDLETKLREVLQR